MAPTINIELQDRHTRTLSAEQLNTLERHSPVPLVIPDTGDAADSIIMAALAAKLDELAAQDVTIEATIESLRKYALAVPELKRGAGEGYPMAAATVDYIAKQLRPPDLTGDWFLTYPGHSGFGRFRWAVRQNPSTRAFAIRDRVVETLTKAPLPEGVQVVVLPLQRINVSGRGGDPDSVFTGVVVMVMTAATKPRYLIVNAEQ